MGKTGTPEKFKGQAGIKIFVHGRFYYKTEIAKGTKPFSLTVRAASLEMFRETSQKYTGTDDKGNAKFKVNSYLNIRGQLKKRLLPILLSKSFPEFARVRFVVVDEIISEKGEKLDLPVNLRSKAQLAVMIQDEKFPIDVNDYVEIDDLRADILQYIQDPDGFLKERPIKAKRRQEDRAFLEMNDLGDEALSPVKTKKEGPGHSADGGGVLD